MPQDDEATTWGEMVDKAGQHILYLCGELRRLVNGLPAHLMATATRV
jgi:hypothetical protein